MKLNFIILIFSLIHSSITNTDTKPSPSFIVDSNNIFEIRNMIVSMLYSQGFSNKYEKDMLEFVIHSYLDKLRVRKIANDRAIGNLSDYFQQNVIIKEIEEFNEKMQNELIKSYGFDLNEDYAQKMKKQPEKYGLTFRAYKILKN